MTDTHLEGGCACGAVRYRLTGEPIFVNNCYCTLCQRQTGSTSVVNAFYEQERIAVLAGTLSEHVVPAGSGAPHQIHRCADCGTALFSYYPTLGDLGAGVRVGTLDDPGAAPPDAAVFVGSRMPWVTLPEGLPAFEGYYKPAELLPPERLDRLRALFAKRAATREARA